MKNILVVTGGAGFIGSNLISKLLKFKKFKIISVDNYSSSSSKNHINNRRVKYLKGSTKDIEILLRSYVGKINSIFHFGEFARIYRSFEKVNECFCSNFNYIYNGILFMYKNLTVDYCKGVTPDPIPNSAVKPFSANGTLS